MSPSAPASAADSPLFRVLGVSLALASATFIGASFILKKKGLLDSNALDGRRPGTGHGYLKNTLWWTGMIMMLVGELCNVAAYAFQPAIIVTPLGSISVVISAVMSDIFLKEKLSFSGKIGCAQCLLGATLLVVNSPSGSVSGSLAFFWTKVWDWGFMSYLVANVSVLSYMILHAARKWGETSPMVYITICSLLGSMVVVVLQVIGSAVVYSAENPDDSQFKDWTFYLLIVFVCCCGVTQINYLNKALNIFSTAIVTPIYFVFFTTATLICSAVLFREFSFSTPQQLVSALVGFLVIVGGVALLFAYSQKLSKGSESDKDAHSDTVPYSPNTSSRSNSPTTSPNMRDALLSPSSATILTPNTEHIGLSRLRINAATSNSATSGARVPSPMARAFWGGVGGDEESGLVVGSGDITSPVRVASLSHKTSRGSNLGVSNITADGGEAGRPDSRNSGRSFKVPSIPVIAPAGGVIVNGAVVLTSPLDGREQGLLDGSNRAGGWGKP
ncbi:magnesium transporter NIPA-domain-containing protein [Chytriomyces cf. hyalinus JEL632]|nr:magnesium transporter NIPA-domain-containing protein [Chytriomyces cf. hyalinus JEL632]